jgi:predicted Rossmann fold flavoprotein
MMTYDVAIIGGGPAGLMAAQRAAGRGRKTILLDKNREPGVKILLSGGTRCNLTHATDARGIVEAFGPAGRFLHSALAALGPQQVIDLFESEGVPSKIEAGGKVFPTSDRASDVHAALMRRVTRSGCTLAFDEPLLDVIRVSPRPLGEGQGVRASVSPRPLGEGQGVRAVNSSQWTVDSGQYSDANNKFNPQSLISNAFFRLVTSKRTISAAKIVLATGGQSYPACGTTGDAYRWAANLGHSIVPPHTALVPITSHAPWVLALQGITLPDVTVRVVDPGDGRTINKASCLASSRGALLFAHFGVTGPAVMDVSHAVSGSPNPNSLVLRCDVLPNVTDGDLDARLADACLAGGKRRVATLLDPWLPHRVGETLLQLIGSPLDQPVAEFSKTARRQLVQTAKRLDIPVAGTMGFRKAEVTAGGVALDEVDSRTMQSRIVPGLYFAGELLDLNGPVGGYNFQAAFSTGWLAGESV